MRNQETSPSTTSTVTGCLATIEPKRKPSRTYDWTGQRMWMKIRRSSVPTVPDFSLPSRPECPATLPAGRLGAIEPELSRPGPDWSAPLVLRPDGRRPAEGSS